MRIRYLSTEPLASEVVAALDRSGATLSVAESLAEPQDPAGRFEAVLYDATTRDSGSEAAIRRLRSERPAVPVIAVVEALDTVASVPASFAPLVDGWIETSILRTTPGRVVSLLSRATNRRRGAERPTGSDHGTSIPDPRALDERRRTKNRCLESLRAGLSHDLRNPLMVAREYAILARETGDDEYLDRTERAVDRAAALVDELVAVARAGRGITTLVEVPIRETATDAWTAVDPGSATLAVETDAFLCADPHLLELFFEVVFGRVAGHGGTNVTVRADGPGFLITATGFETPTARYRAFRTALDDTDTDDCGATLVSAIAAAHGWDAALEDPDDAGFRLRVGP
ncbi:HAMP domain-containing sensor histidine kinase [Halalkalicoccus sp. NIPERK01]|uniref:sensor histidine kinase n=1 Tax=Halalkalicoccus sp. NIPERK01 TaxID=3053469 RepID=UPI00256F16E6|nr:histidine kinase dimerization/phospho-acceptor domain-containing protein [Halalkalicoccus sp. NIPERK01]MDL5363299.1 histidine kinase dimerization/phospho-acceptor domain-containing protein [Halalkalicoccus sp. NIPERK01]